MRVTNQGGSLAGFIIIGVLLTLVLVGGLYGLNRYNAQKASEEVAAREEAATKSTESTKTEKETIPGDAEPNGRERTGSPSSSSQKSEDKPVATTPTTGGAATQANLPQTGPADTLMSIVALGSLAFAGAHYARSRQ